MKSFIARTEWKLAKVLQAGQDYPNADAAVMEKRSRKFLADVTDCKDGVPQDDDRLEQIFDSLIFFWSR